MYSHREPLAKTDAKRERLRPAPAASDPHPNVLREVQRELRQCADLSRQWSVCPTAHAAAHHSQRWAVGGEQYHAVAERQLLSDDQKIMEQSEADDEAAGRQDSALCVRFGLVLLLVRRTELVETSDLDSENRS